jgi:hypothetical protein
MLGVMRLRAAIFGLVSGSWALRHTPDASLAMVLFGFLEPENTRMAPSLGPGAGRASTPVYALRPALMHARQQGSEDLPRLEKAQPLLSDSGNRGLL